MIKLHWKKLLPAALGLLIVGTGIGLYAISTSLPAKEKTSVFDTSNSDQDNHTLLQQPMKRDGQIYLRLANNQKTDFPTSIACDYFADLVEERTDGRIHIITYHSAMLGDEKSTVAQLRYGGIDMVRASIALMAEYSPQLTALEMPYLYRDSEHMWQVLDSDIGEYFLESMKESGLEGLCWYDAGARNFYTTQKQITKPEDLKGLKIRVQQSAFMIDLISTLGAIPVDLPYEAVWGQLRLGSIDGAENNFPSYMSTGHSSVAPYMVLDAHTRIPEMIVVNRKVIEQLTPEDQEIIRKAARDSSLLQRKLWNEEEEKNRKAFEEAGGIITHVENKADFVKRVQPLYKIYAPKYGKLIDKIRQVGLSEK
ncbi:MAG: TRAP transporter substrate-binding protein [Eubacteriales bacterium]|nr:TRAP transporter substrate-binding protein [Eubacteriales bacterium]